MSEIELKPCPFCGSDDIKDDVYMRDGREVVCRECKARVGEFNPNANDKAVEKWNRRASEVSNEWVKWDGGNFMPVPGEAVVTVMLRDGSIEGPARAREFAGTESCWEHRDSDGDIIAYRLAQSDFDSRIRSALEPVGYVTLGEIDLLRRGRSCVDLFRLPPADFASAAVYATPPAAQVTESMRVAACRALNERGKGNNVTICDVVAVLAAALSASPSPVDSRELIERCGWRQNRREWRKYPFVITERGPSDYAVTVHHKTAGVSSQFGVTDTLENAIALVEAGPVPEYAAKEQQP